MIPQNILKAFLSEQDCEDIKKYTEIYDQKFEDALDIVSRFIGFRRSITVSESDAKSSVIKATTASMLCYIAMARKGRKITSLTEEDWKQISETIIGFAFKMDSRKYSSFVFKMWATAIDETLEVQSLFISDKTIKAVGDIVDKLRAEIKLFDDGNENEITFIRNSECFCMEAVIHILINFAIQYIPEWGQDIGHAVASLIFELGRYRLYVREYELLTEYEEHKVQHNIQLDNQFSTFIEELKNITHQNLLLINGAFSGNADVAFTGSIILANMLGVDDKELLHNESEIDDFFLE